MVAWRPLSDGLSRQADMSLRIVQILDNLDLGGMERLAIDLAVAHKAAGHQPSLYCIGEPGALAPEAEAAGIPVTAFYKKPGFSPATVLRIARHLRRNAADVVHTHNPSIHIYGALAARLAWTPVVVNTRHSPVNSQGRSYLESHFRTMLPLTNHVVFVSQDCRRILEKRCGVTPAKCRVIRNGVPLDRFLSHPASPGSLQPRFRFGTVGRMIPMKDHAALIESFALLSGRLPQAELRIIGGGPLFEELQGQVSRLGLTDRIAVEGPRNDIPEVLAELDVFVFSSLSEGLPVVILEAMAAGLPIVSTRVGGVPEVAPEGRVAWYCPPGNAEALAEAMLAAAQSDNLAAMGDAAREVAREHFRIEGMQQAYDKLFNELLGRRA